MTRVNLDGVFFIFRAAAKHMVERGKGGSLVATASTAAIEGAARNSHYGASKGGVCRHGAGRSPSSWRATTSRVNSILPGWIETEMTANALDNPKFAGNVMPRIPERRWGVDEDFGPLRRLSGQRRHAIHHRARLRHRWRLHAVLGPRMVVPALASRASPRAVAARDRTARHEATS